MLRLRDRWIHDDTCLVKGQRLIKSFSDHFYWQWIGKEALLGTARKHHGIHHRGTPTSPWWGPRNCFLIPANLMRSGPSNPPNVTKLCIRKVESVFICPYFTAILRYPAKNKTFRWLVHFSMYDKTNRYTPTRIYKVDSATLLSN